MWFRMFVEPGRAEIAGENALPLAVDVQVRKVTEYLGVTNARGQDSDVVRTVIQDAWRADIAAGGSHRPLALEGTCAALEPALWYFGEWSCTQCERAVAKVPVHAACEACRLEELRRR